MITINDNKLSYTTVKNLIINMDFNPETTQVMRKECIIEFLTGLTPIEYDLCSYMSDIVGDNVGDGMYTQDIEELTPILIKLTEDMIICYR